MVGYGYGKVILFGEHFVVYGLPGLAGGIGNRTEATAKESGEPGLHVVDNRPAVEGYKEKKADQFKESLEYIKKAIPQVDWNTKGVKITLAGNLIAASGVGASAASCAAIARAISEFFKLGLDDETINHIAYEGERGYHGSPSGLDNTCATYGSLIIFRKTEEGGQMKRLGLEQKVEMVMANTGIPVDTKAIVDGVKSRKDEDPDRFRRIFKDYEDLYIKAYSALEAGDWKRVGELMDENQELLREIGVSHPKLEELIDTAKGAGAYGAKLTGGGVGGYMVALTPGKELQDAVYAALKGRADIVLKTSVGNE